MKSRIPKATLHAFMPKKKYIYKLPAHILHPAPPPHPPFLFFKKKPGRISFFHLPPPPLPLP